jgi:hypothetical protein
MVIPRLKKPYGLAVKGAKVRGCTTQPTYFTSFLLASRPLFQQLRIPVGMKRLLSIR